MDKIAKKNCSTSSSSLEKATALKKAHCGSTNGLAFCDDGVHMLTYGAHEAKMRRWDLTSGRNTKTPFVKLEKRSSSNKNKICTKLSLSPSYGRRDGVVFIPEGSNIASLDVNTGKSITRLRGHYHGVYCTAFNEQSQELFSGGGDKSILLWESNQEAANAFDEHLKSVGDERERGQKEKLLPDGWSSSDDE